jgi:hypothetical protein
MIDQCTPLFVYCESHLLHQWGEPYGVTVHKKRGVLNIHSFINRHAHCPAPDSQTRSHMRCINRHVHRSTTQPDKQSQCAALNRKYIIEPDSHTHSHMRCINRHACQLTNGDTDTVMLWLQGCTSQALQKPLLLKAPCRKRGGLVPGLLQHPHLENPDTPPPQGSSC